MTHRSNRLGYILKGVIGEFEYELARLDLGQIEHVIDKSKQMLAVAFKPSEHRQHLL